MSRRRFSPAFVLVALVCVLTRASPAVGAAGNDPWEALNELPGMVDAAAVLDGPGTTLLNDFSGPEISDALAAGGLFARTRAAWSGLASALGYTERQAAEALLGGRVVIGWENLTGGGVLDAPFRADALWVLIAEIDTPTAKRVRARLDAAPRRITGARVVYSVDAGRMGMSVFESDGRTLIVLAPNEAARMLDAVVEGDASGSLGDRAHAALGDVAPGWTAVVVGGTDPARTAAMELRHADDAWRARFVAPANVADAEEKEEDNEWGAPAGVLKVIGGDALLAMATDGSSWMGNASTLNLPMRLGTNGTLRLDSGVVLVLRELADDAGLTALILTHARADDRFAERTDRMISAMVGGKQPPGHHGAFPDAVRVHPIGSKGGWPGPGGRVAWCLGPGENDRAGVISMVIGPEGADLARLARNAREAWARADSPRDPSLVSAGLAAPSALADALDLRPANPVLELAHAVERVEWSVRRHEDMLHGEVLVRFVTPDARLGEE